MVYLRQLVVSTLLVALLGVSHGFNFDLANQFRALGFNPSLTIGEIYSEVEPNEAEEQYLDRCYVSSYGEKDVDIFELSVEQALERFLDQEKGSFYNTINISDVVDTARKIRQFVKNLKVLALEIKSCLKALVKDPSNPQWSVGMQSYFLTADNYPTGLVLPSSLSPQNFVIPENKRKFP